MRVNRAKAVRKHLQFYQIVFGLDKAVYHCILDGNFIYAGVKYKVDIRDRLRTLLQGADVKIYVLSSVLEELRQAGEKTRSALEFAKKFCEVLDDAGHSRGNSSATVSDRIVNMMRLQHDEWASAPGKKKRKFLVATQDKGLRAALAHVPGIPLVYLNKVILVLEPPSTASREFNLQVEANKVSLKPAEAELMVKLKKRKGALVGTTIIDAPLESGGGGGDDGSQGEDAAKPAGARTKHKAFAANPLASMAPSENSQKQKKRRKDKFRR